MIIYVKLFFGNTLIAKLTRGAMFLALRSNNPSYSAKVFGANRWSDFNIIIEPTIAIPYICSLLYENNNNMLARIALKSIKRALKLDCNLYIPFFYINECAGHLLEAKNYVLIDLDENEMQYSTNAFVSYYFSMKNKGIRVPESLLEYLSTFSSSIKTEQNDRKAWTRAIMTDIQSILNRSEIEYLDVPLYTHDDCKMIEEQYSYYLLEKNMDKRPILCNHDIYAMQFTNDSIINKNEHWVILTYDNTLIKFSNQDFYKGWITNPLSFLDLTQTSNKLSDTQFISLIHSFATFSETTLSIGARIIDKILLYASNEMQNWQFKNEVENFKKQMIIESSNINYDDFINIDKKINEFLRKHNIKINEKE
jgi:hypothetical protein